MRIGALTVFLRRRYEVIICLSLGIFSTLLRSLPFLKNLNPLGYDTGFYRRYLTQPFLSFPNGEVPGLGNDALFPRFVLDILRLFHLPTDIILYGVYIFVFALLPILLFIWLKPTSGTRVASIAGLFLILSPVQYVGFWFMLLKNVMALGLVFLAFISFEKRWFIPLLALDIGIALSHKTTAVIYLLTLAVLALIHAGRRKEIFVHCLITGLCFVAVNTTLAHVVIRAAPVAVFLGWSQYLTLSIPFLALALFGIPSLFKKKISPALVAFSFVSILFPILHLPFYERIFIFSDIALLVFAAFGIEYLISRIDWKKPKSLSYSYFAVICIVVGTLLGNLWNEIRARSPLVSERDIAKIEQIGDSVPKNAIILTTSEEAPWYEGWTLSHIAAPGMLRDTHNLEMWQEIWYATGTTKTTRLLNDFSRPLFISTLNDFNHLIGNRPSCATQINPQLLEYKCKK